ncbi:heme-binding protein [Nocardioides sp. SOB77]|uniref:Heme-binding protein n=1 Tax=Nocardioides oceani TaxID=3058369 RepID=A0ABT8FCG6_9ACTN|nr:heme-binding protein [Nocardioides oceani]MDN4172381.1 heme-binding protein [Nocardioides oceani]
MKLSLDLARQIVRDVHAQATTLQLRPLTVVVLDGGGHVLVAERADGSPIGSFEIARGKAYGALALGMGSRRIMERAEAQPYFVTAAAAALAGRLIPVPGGILVRDGDGNAIGALGVSGDASDSDEAVGVAAISAVHLIPQPS